MIKYLIIFFLSSCHYFSDKEKKVDPAPIVSPDPGKYETLLSKRDLYLDLTSEVRNDFGFINNCDSLLFTSLSVFGGVDAEYGQAESRDVSGTKTGRWFRHSDQACYSSGRSKSTTSRDMLTGLLWALYHKGDVASTERTIEYARANGWRIGEGPISRIIMTPQIRRQYADLYKELGGERDYTIDRLIPLTWPAGLVGYESHLQILQILFRLFLDGDVTREMYDRIIEHSERSPRNVTFSIARNIIESGDFSGPIDTLLDESLFPASSLPHAGHRCEEYLWQRDDEPRDWGPCSKDEVHSGSDLLFATALIERWLAR